MSLKCFGCNSQEWSVNLFGGMWCSEICALVNQSWTDIPCPEHPRRMLRVSYSSECYPCGKHGETHIHWRTDLQCHPWHLLGEQMNSPLYLETIKKLDERTGPHVFDRECWCYKKEKPYLKSLQEVA